MSDGKRFISFRGIRNHFSKLKPTCTGLYEVGVMMSLRRAHNWNGESLVAGKGNGEGKGRGKSVYKQPGARVDRDRTMHKGGIPSK
jgi:hypothetical protein